MARRRSLARASPSSAARSPPTFDNEVPDLDPCHRAPLRIVAMRSFATAPASRARITELAPNRCTSEHRTTDQWRQDHSSPYRDRPGESRGRRRFGSAFSNSASVLLRRRAAISGGTSRGCTLKRIRVSSSLVEKKAARLGRPWEGSTLTSARRRRYAHRSPYRRPKRATVPSLPTTAATASVPRSIARADS